MLETVFTELGFSSKELEVYTVLLRIGLASAAIVAKEINLPRQTIYTLIRHLVAEGIIEESDKRGVKQFFADPDRLLSYIDRKRKTLEKNQDELKKELPKLFMVGKRKNAFPKIAYYEGESGLKRLFENILDQYKKGEEEVFRGYGINTIHGLLHGYIPDFLQERYELGAETHLFIGRGSDDFAITDHSNALGRTVKRLNMNPQKAGLYIVGQRLYLFSYEDLVGVMIENEAMARLMRAVFDANWSEK